MQLNEILTGLICFISDNKLYCRLIKILEMTQIWKFWAQIKWCRFVETYKRVWILFGFEQFKWKQVGKHPQQRRPSLTNCYMLPYSMYTKIPLTFCMQYKNNPILHSFSVWKQACLKTCHYIIFPPWSRHTDRYRF